MNANQRATNAYCDMMNKTFENIVGRVFINSIPISKDELSPEVRRDLTKYAVSAIESAGGINLLTNAILNETNPQKKSFMLQMFDICDTTSKEVSNRVALEAARGTTAKNTAKTVKNSTTTAVNAIKESLKELTKRDDMKALFANNRNVKKCAKVSVSNSLTEVVVLDGSSEDIAKFKAFLKELNKLVTKKMSGAAGSVTIKVDYSTGSFTITPKNMNAKEARESALDIFDPVMEAGDDDAPDLTEKTDEDLKKESDDDAEDSDDSDATKEKDTADDNEKDDETTDGDADDKEEDKAESPALTVRSLQTANVDAKMTDEEYEKFSNKVDSLDIAKISNIVNEKVVNAIADEKENYHAMDESNSRLKDAILKDDSVADEKAAESVIESILEIPKKKYQSEYQSLFSKLQLMAVESIALKPEIDMSKPDVDILTDITINSTFDAFANKAATESTLIDTLNRAISMQSALEGTAGCDCNTEKFVQLGTAFATIIMALLETLHTMGFINPTSGDIKNIVNADTTVAKSIASIKNDVDNKVDIALENNEKRLNGYKSSGAVEATLVNLGTLKNKLIDATESGIDISFDTFSRIDALIEKARTKLTALENADEIGYDLSNDRRHEEDILKANRVQKYVAARKPEHADFICTENAGSIGVDISCYKDNKVVYHSAMALEGTHNGITAEDYVNLILNKSNFAGMTGLRIRGKNKTIDM